MNAPTPDKWTRELILLMAKGMVSPPPTFACKTCKVIYSTEGRAKACERGHELYPTAPSQFHPANREPINTAPKSEVYFGQGQRLCGDCSAKVKGEDATFTKVMILNPEPCTRCNRPILPPVQKEIERPSFLKPSERHEIMRLDRSRKGKCEQLRRVWHRQMVKTEGYTTGSEEVDRKTQNENGLFRDDIHRGNVRTPAGGYIEVDPECEEVEFKL